ncbi:type II toxin-antitoxin system VapB family antitoxin [Dietzia timorensis]|uniref:Antitoxin VapB n=1 Tax=Dietzia timorensis TaxID=499555 RepID=A0A173LMD4_9ACTN|nr:type II toxin-antitoxin system VapB family antitoxin [Dietzia timorensis]ANI91730.1 Hypothetical protein BJL86_0937 [Dietzia timorensis]
MATLNIKDPRVHELATELARRRGTTATAVVRDALEKELDETPVPIDIKKIEALQQRARELNLAWYSDEDLYDEDGLPK